MKRILAGVLALSLFASGAVQAQDRHGGGRDRGDRGERHQNYDRGDRGDRGDRNRGGGERYRGGQERFRGNDGYRGDGYRGQAYRGDRRGDWNRNGWDRGDRRWAGNDGYRYRGGGYRDNYRYGRSHRWARGGYWRPSYGGYYVNDPYRYGLYDAPYGYRWVRSDSGDYLLAAIATGLIISVIANQY
jgi:Ni/Co efflux regulator RcnB